MNEKLKVPIKWKLSTAFFPFSVQLFTRTNNELKSCKQHLIACVKHSPKYFCNAICNLLL